MSVHILPALDSVFHLSLSPVAPLPASLVVSRLESEVPAAECALCWGGPGHPAAMVRERSAAPESARLICSRCLITLEMLATQFGADLLLAVESAP